LPEVAHQTRSDKAALVALRILPRLCWMTRKIRRMSTDASAGRRP